MQPPHSAALSSHSLPMTAAGAKLTTTRGYRRLTREKRSFAKAHGILQYFHSPSSTIRSLKTHPACIFR